MERLSPLDASFLYIEDGVSHMHIAACAVLEGPAPAYGEVTGAIARKLDRVPRYRQVVRFVPLQLDRPVWVDDPHFRLEYHVRHTALPPPGGDAELRDLMGRLMSQELDRRRPLWEAWMVEGLTGGRWAFVSKIHHCLADGVSGTDLLGAILDSSPDAADGTAPPSPWVPEPSPSTARLTAAALARLARLPYDQLRAAARALGDPGAAVARVRDVAGGLVAYARRIPSAPPSSLVGGIGPHRRWTWASADLDDVKLVKRTFGGTVNDVIVAAVAAGFRNLLDGRGEAVGGLVVRALIPVSVRSEDERGAYNNRVSAMFADLPVAVDDPIERLIAVSEQMEQLKASHQTAAGEGLVALGGFGPATGIAIGERGAVQVMHRLPQHSINTVVTNIPGPQFPLYLAGRRMLEYLPFVPVFYGMRIGVAIVSYDGHLAFGVTGDYDTTPDLDAVAAGIEHDIAQLVALAHEATARTVPRLMPSAS